MSLVFLILLIIITFVLSEKSNRENSKCSKYDFKSTKDLAMNVANLIYQRYEMHNKTLLQFFQISSNIAEYD